MNNLSVNGKRLSSANLPPYANIQRDNSSLVAIQTDLHPTDSAQDRLILALGVNNEGTLPNLERAQIKEVNTFLNTKRFTLNFSIRSFLDEILSDLGCGAKAEIIGGYARWIIRRNQQYCENALQTKLESELFDNAWESPADWDIKITLQEGRHNLPDALACVIRKLQDKGTFTLQKKCLIDQNKNQFAIVNYEDLEILLVLNQERDRVFEHEGLRLSYPIKKVIGNRQSLVDLLSRSIQINTIETVNEHGWPRLMSCKIRGYRARDVNLAHQLFEKVTLACDSEELLQGNIFQLLSRQIGNHHSNDTLAATALLFQSAYSLQNAGLSTNKLWGNFSSWTRVPYIERGEIIERSIENPLEGILTLLKSDPTCFSTLSALLEIVGFCGLGKGIFTLTKDEGRPAISMKLPSDFTLLLPCTPLIALKTLDEAEFPLEQKFLYFFRKLIESSKIKSCQRELSFETELVSYAKRFLKDPRKLIREIGFEILLTIEESSLENTHISQILYELSKRKHSFERVGLLLEGFPIPNPYHTPSQWVESLLETNNKTLMPVACQMWSELPIDEKLPLGVPLCKTLIGLDHSLLIRMFRHYLKFEIRNIENTSNLFCMIVRSFTEGELVAALPTLLKASKKLIHPNQSEAFTQALIFLQTRFGSELENPIIEFKQKWEQFKRVRLATSCITEDTLTAFYQLITDKEFLDVCESPAGIYHQFLNATIELGIHTHQSMINKVLPLFIQYEKNPIRLLCTLRDFWHPNFPLTKNIKRELEKSASLFISKLREENKPECLCELSILLENYGLTTCWNVDDLIWGVTQILPDPIGKSVLNQILKTPKYDVEAVIEIALIIKESEIALDLIRHLPVENIKVSWIVRLASLNFDVAANYLSDLNSERSFSPEKIHRIAEQLAPYGTHGNPMVVAQFHLEYPHIKPQSLDTLIIQLVKIASRESTTHAIHLAEIHEIQDFSLWLAILEKSLQLSQSDESVFIHLTNQFCLILNKLPPAQFDRLLTIGVFALKGLKAFGSPRADKLIHKLSYQLINLNSKASPLDQVDLVKAMLASASRLKITTANMMALDIYIDRLPLLKRNCFEEALDSLITLTESAEGEKLFNTYTTRALMRLGGENCKDFFEINGTKELSIFGLIEPATNHPEFLKFKKIFFKFMVGLLRRALEVPLSDSNENSPKMYDFIARNLTSLIFNFKEPSRALAQLIYTYVFCIPPSSTKDFQEHIKISKSFFVKAVNLTIFDRAQDLTAECVMYLDFKVCYLPELLPYNQKEIMNRLIDRLLSYGTTESIAIASYAFAGTHRFIFRNEYVTGEYDHKALFSAYKRIIDASREFPYEHMDEMAIFDIIFGIAIRDNVFFGLDGTSEGIRCAEKTSHYLVNNYIHIYKNLSWTENTRATKIALLEFIMKCIKMCETHGAFRHSHGKYFEFIEIATRLFMESFTMHSDEFIREIISVYVDLISLRNPANKFSLNKVSSSTKRVQMQFLLSWVSELKKIATPEQMECLRVEVNILINTNTFFAGHHSTLKKIIKLLN